MNSQKIVHATTDNKQKNQEKASCEAPTRPSVCERCGGPVKAEHAHFKCRQCGWLTHCCEGGQG